MSDVVIRVENLSKKYTLSHQKEGQSNSVNSLRELMEAGSQAIGDRLRGRGPIDDPTKEDFWALKDVNFEIKQGDRVGIIGRNGAGKSTLLKVLSRIVEPTTGEIGIKGRVASLLEVGTGFHPELSGRENIFLNGAILGMSKAEITRKFDEIVDFAEVEKFLDTPVKRYSSGMYVRLAFAVAAHLEPEILIVDEVLAVGDAAFQKKCLGKMEDVGKEGRTIIFVSHNIQAIRRLCNEAIYLEKGLNKAAKGVEHAIDMYSIQSIISKSEIDLESIERRSGLGEKARILKIQLPSTSSLRYGQKLELVFTVECFQEIPDLTVGIGFDSLDGYRIMTLDSDQGQSAFKMSTGIHEVRIVLDRNPLSPGQYTVGVALLSGNHILDLILNEITWEVGSGNTDLVSDRGNGGCRLLVKTLVSQYSS